MSSADRERNQMSQKSLEALGYRQSVSDKAERDFGLAQTWIDLCSALLERISSISLARPGLIPVVRPAGYCKILFRYELGPAFLSNGGPKRRPADETVMLRLEAATPNGTRSHKRCRSGKHSVQVVATSVRVSVYRKAP